MGLDPHVAIGRQKHHEAIPLETPAPSTEASVKDKMRHKLGTTAGKALYAARKQIVEPVFGMIKSARGIHKFLLRGLEKVSAEWQLICLTHNLLKIWRRAQSRREFRGIVRTSVGSRPQRPKTQRNRGPSLAR